MEKLFAVAFTPEELGAVMVSLGMIRSNMPNDTEMQWVLRAMETALEKCEAIRPEAIKYVSSEAAESMNAFHRKYGSHK